MAAFYCPNCGAELSSPSQPCPFCTEAQRLVQQIAEKDEVRLCARCGTLIEEGSDNLCPACRKAVSVPRAPWRREDRVAGWIRDRLVEPVAERQGIVCPSCQTALPPLAVFCSQCGYRLTEAPPAPGPPTETTPIASPPTGAAAAAPAAAALAPGVAAPAPAAGAPENPPPAPAAAGSMVWPRLRSWWQQQVEFWRDQFRPRGPVVETPQVPWWQQAGRWLRSQLLGGDTNQIEIWLWIVLGALVIGIVIMYLLWADLLRSSELIFR